MTTREAAPGLQRRRSFLPAAILCLALAPMTRGKDRDREAAPGPVPVPQATGVSASDDYMIGVEDLLEITVWKNPDLTKDVPVRPDGKITLPLIDDVTAAGLTTARLKEVLTEAWKAFITAPEVSVIVKEVNSQKVYMVGEVIRPGMLTLKSRTTLLQALSLAGGFTPYADRSNIVVLTRDGTAETRREFNYRRILSGSRPEDNIVLRAGDTVIVP